MFILLVKYEKNTLAVVQNNLVLLIVALVVSFGAIIAMACVESVRRTSPTNMIVLGIFTLAETYLVGASTMRFDPEDVSSFEAHRFVRFCYSVNLSIGAASYWRNRSRMRWTDNICLPNEMGLHHARWNIVRGIDCYDSVRFHCNVLPGQNDDIGLFIVWCDAVLRLFDLRHSDDDGWKS